MSRPKNKEEYRQEMAKAFANVLEEKGLQWRKEWHGTGGRAPHNGITKEDSDLSSVRTGLYNPREDIAMLFSRPESIDSVISVLKAVKKATFGENNLVNNYLSD